MADLVNATRIRLAFSGEAPLAARYSRAVVITTAVYASR
jgi:hypothetical protein